jgi:hypothetical protein
MAQGAYHDAQDGNERRAAASVTNNRREESLIRMSGPRIGNRRGGFLSVTSCGVTYWQAQLPPQQPPPPPENPPDDFAGEPFAEALPAVKTES